MRPDWNTIESMAQMSRAFIRIRDMLSGGLLFRHNFAGRVVEIAMTSGVEQPIENPLPFKPVGFVPWFARINGGAPVRIADYGFNPDRSDGMLGITVTTTSGSAIIVSGFLVAG